MICDSISAPAVCGICGGAALYRCGWKLERYVVARIEDIRLGDLVRRYADEDGTKPGVAFVESVQPLPKDEFSEQGWAKIALRIHYKHGGYKQKWFDASLKARIRVLRKTSCGEPCCECCVREVSEDRHYCRGHWDAWERSGELDQSRAVA